MKKPFVLIVTGPTGVGKTAFVDELARNYDIEIINGDMGQLYEPLSIGTAKPDWKRAPIPHHLFDYLVKPDLFSVTKYRAVIKKMVEKIWQRKKVPVIVGGSGFYLLSLFFPPLESDVDPGQVDAISQLSHEQVWKEIKAADPVRAKEIGKHDHYRLSRALAIWRSTGKKPSTFQPQFDPIAQGIVIWLSRDRKELYERIDARVLEMIELGWIEEVQNLKDSPWEKFLRKKKIIGYDLIFQYLDDEISYSQLIEQIQKKTRNYAKRQISFWSRFKKLLSEALGAKGTDFDLHLFEYNLTDHAVDSYIKQLKKELLKYEH